MNRKVALLLVVTILALLGIGGYVVVNRSGEKVEDSENLTKALEENNTSTNSLEETKEEQTNPNENAQTQTNPDETTSRNIAVVYFSATGNTKQVAEYIQQATNASIFEIIPTKVYTSDDLTWSNSDSRATKEQNDKSARPEIQNEIELSSYDIVFLGYPIWWGDTPRIIQTFMESHELKGKTVIPFCTSSSSGISGSERTLKEYQGINWVAGKRLTGSIDDVEKWIKSLNIIESVETKKEGEALKTNQIKMVVNQHELTVELENNLATTELLQKLNMGEIVVNASEYGGFEKVGSLGFSLPREDKQITTKAGDIVLYQGNQISLFYESNSWSYTKLGKVTNVSAEELRNILGDGNVTLIIKK